MVNKKDEKLINNIEKEKIKNQNDFVTNEVTRSLEKKSEKYQEEIIKLQLKYQEEITKLNNRLNIEIEKHRKFSLEKIIIDFLLIIDNIERALNIAKEKKEEIFLEIFKKIKFVSFLLENILSEFKISKINEKNVLFNPDIHQAMSISYTDEIQYNHIVNIMQPGYILFDSRLLRPAMVIVSKGKKNS